MQIELRRVQLSRTTMAWRELESDTARTVLLLHAMWQSSADWDQVATRIAPHRRVIAPDLRGHGDTVVERPDYSFEAMRDDVVELLDSLRCTEVDVIGHSMGGTVACLGAESRGDLVRRLVLADTAPPRGLRQIDLPDVMPTNFAHNWEMTTSIVAQLNSPNLRWYDDLARISCPTLIIGGGADSPVDQEALEEAARRIPNGRFIAIGGGHYVHASEPEPFLSVTMDFLLADNMP
jgi:pimeloyl-ACP methyl ester carboxylesterase